MTARGEAEKATSTAATADPIHRSASKARRASWRSLDATWQVVLAAFLVSRALFFTVGGLAAAFVSSARPATDTPEPGGFLHYWAHWDGAWYEGIARHGYPGFHPPLSTAFFPLYPLVVRGGAAIFGSAAVAGVVLSSALFLLALYFVARIAETLLGREVARATTLALAFFPTSVFFNAVFTESLFLALSAGAVWALVVRDQPLLAGALSGFATATRQVGLLLLIPLGYELWRKRDRYLERLAALALVPLGLVAYMAYLRVEFGRWTLFVDAERDFWGRRLRNPVHTLGRALHEARLGASGVAHPTQLFRHSYSSSAVYIAALGGVLVLALGAGLVVVAFRAQPAALPLYAAGTLAVPVLYPPFVSAVASVARYYLVAFPLFIALGSVLARSRAVLTVWVVVTAALGCYVTVLFVTWRWLA